MKAGRELDVLVADKVMGWKRDGSRIVRPDGSSFEGPEENMPDDDLYARYSYPSYSTNMASAMEVVCKVSMWDESKRVDFGMELRNALGLVGGSREPSYADIVDDLAKLTPEAICRAALKAWV